MGSFRDILNDLPLALRRKVERKIAENAKTPPDIKKFYLNRKEDESGVSGTGIVAVGVELPSGRCVMEWISKRTDANSLGIYDNMDDLEKVHGHDGKSTVEYYNGED